MKPIFSLLCLLVLSACSHVDVPEGYRMNRYKAPVPDYVPHATTITWNKVRDLQKEGAILIDVIGSARLLSPGIKDDWIIVKPHLSIPGSVWLPDVGRGALSPKQAHYFQTALTYLTQDTTTPALIFFCRENCWMSWNATKRAASYGYKHLYWYRDGIEGWEKAGLKTSPLSPFSIRHK